VDDLFSQAHEIKKWLIECAKLVVNNNQPVAWITPLGIPVIQPYRVASKIDNITTSSNNLDFYQIREYSPLLKRKQQTAFPPNFVHR
jgi:DNA-directed RNA polymerase